ncbi:hypothetical protein V6N12_014510 [Hibiscus sabdariffa]|uniref:ABC transporter domain-containing protein n=1 Tax=Hibiscus sabdariffa TaxID=183260 RepID=A0ABR2DKD7_9ROSI
MDCLERARNLSKRIGISTGSIGRSLSRSSWIMEEALKWAAIERLPTYDRLRTIIMQSFVDHEIVRKKVEHREVDVTKLDVDDRQKFMDMLFKVAEEDNEKYLMKFRNRIDRVGIKLPTVEVRFEHLTIDANCYIGSRALPSLSNVTRNIAESVLGMLGIQLAKTTNLTILKDVSGIVKPSRMTLLLGPPSSGKTTLLLALAGKLDASLRVKGEGVGNRYDLLRELARREKEAGIFPEANFDLFMKATAMEGVESSLITDYTLKLLGLDICKDTIVGDEMHRGVSGGQKKRDTTGEMIVGPTKTLFMDEISTGLDSSTTYQIVKCLQQIVHLTEATIFMSLLQPAPEAFDLFDDIVLLSEGQIVYQGPREHIVEFFETCGFKCPERNGTADFLQEVTSKKDQEQYWADRSKPYRYISVSEFESMFKSFHAGMQLHKKLSVPFDKSRGHRAALAFQKYSVSRMELLKVPISILESVVWMVVTYYTIGFAPEAGRFFKQFLLVFLTQQMAAGLFRLIIGLCRTMVIANTGGALTLLLVFLFQNVSINDKASDNVTQLGVQLLRNYDIPNDENWYWIGAALGKPQAVISEETTEELEANYEGITEEPRLRRPKSSKDSFPRSFSTADALNSKEMEIRRMSSRTNPNGMSRTDSSLDAAIGVAPKRGMVLPFTPLAMSFDTVNYYVDMPPEMKAQGVTEDRLQLLREVTSAFRPGVLTALMGVNGAGKTTLMDVLAGRKTGGYIEGDIRISGFPKVQETFARISGYCKQSDIHSPQVTVKESLIYSTFLRLPKEVSNEEKMIFVDEVMELVELDNLKDAIVGLPGVTGLSTEQRKRLTIAVELVANPSIIFMDEPTSRLDARAAAIVTRTVRNTSIPGVPKIKEKYNPATWMLEVSSVAAEVRLGMNFAEHYKSSSLYHPDYNLVRYFFTLVSALMIGTIFWQVGTKRETTTDLIMIIGAMNAAVLFVGIANCSTVQPLVATERTVFYREQAAGMYSALPYAMA